MRQVTATVGTRTYQKIKRDIIFGALESGSKLKLDALKARYNASLSTLRETLNRLASEGFVDAPEQRGFFVKSVSAEDLHEIAHLRVLLECHALRLSIANGDTEWEGDLVAAHHKLHVMELRLLAGDESEEEGWKRYDWEFHKMLILTHRGQEAAEEHREMFEAALARDADRAVATLKTHIAKGLDHAVTAMGQSLT